MQRSNVHASDNTKLLLSNCKQTFLLRNAFNTFLIIRRVISVTVADATLCFRKIKFHTNPLRFVLF